MPEDYVATIVSELLLVPYVAWGVYMLSQRYRYHYESGPVIEAVTLLGVLLFMAVEISLFKTWMQNNTVLYVFTLLGLMVSMGALYGHMAISFTSWLIVESISAGDDSDSDAPRMGPVEALERQRDFEGALNECLVIARIYPREAVVHLHMADNLLELKRPEEAAAALERALKYVAEPEKNLQVTNRLCEVLTRDLQAPERAEEALRQYARRYPNSGYQESIMERIGRLEHPVEWHAPAALASLEELPVEEEAEEEVFHEAVHMELAPLDVLEDLPLIEEEAEESAPPPPAMHFSLSALDEAPLEEEPEEELPRTTGAHLTLEAVEETPKDKG